MSLSTRLIPDWPALAWVARIAADQCSAQVWHGPLVEARPEFCTEGVWVGDFRSGDFDSATLMFGSGIRFRDGLITCVPSSTTLDRLWHLHDRHGSSVSNSLPCLLASTGSSLLDSYPRYHADIATLTGGLSKVRTQLPLDDAVVEVTYHHNVVFRPGGWSIVPKPPVSASFTSFDGYHDFLRRSAQALGENARSTARRHPVATAAAISSGYDSPAAAAIARHAGCQLAFTITRARSYLAISDSGAQIAAQLGIPCQEIDPRQIRPSHEEWFWAALAEPTDLNLSTFQFPHVPCVLFTGFMGDRIWDRRPHDLTDPFVRADLAGLGFTEYRLLAGVAHAPVPTWGLDCAHAGEVQHISASTEMRQWTMGGDYDRPICRRILEEAGVPRGFFATRKKATTFSAERYHRPVDPQTRARFESYARQRGAQLGAYWIESLVSVAEEDFLSRTRAIPGLGFLRLRPGNKAGALAFQWANAELAEVYRSGLRSAGLGHWKEHP